MTFLSRRKRPTILHAAPTRLARRTISALALALLFVCLPALQAQSFRADVPPPPAPEFPDQSFTPRYVPAPIRGNSVVVPAAAVDKANPQPNAGLAPTAAQMPWRNAAVKETDIEEPLINTELPGAQKLFRRQSEEDFFNRIRKQTGKQGVEFLLPKEKPVSKISYTTPSYPRLDPATRTPFMFLHETVEPSYVVHRRLLFEQPNFERSGYDLGVLQPAAELAVFYYDMAMLPYHCWSDLDQRLETSAGKCLPGDPTPFRIVPERFSMTGLLAEVGTVTGGIYMLNFPWLP